jgi:hypothetical protein
MTHGPARMGQSGGGSQAAAVTAIGTERMRFGKAQARLQGVTASSWSTGGHLRFRRVSMHVQRRICGVDLLQALCLQLPRVTSSYVSSIVSSARQCGG